MEELNDYMNDTPIVVQYWETELDRDDGLSEVYKYYPESAKEEAIQEAKHLMHLMDYACVEVWNTATEETYYWTDGVTEDYFDNDIKKESKENNTPINFEFGKYKGIIEPNGDVTYNIGTSKNKMGNKFNYYNDNIEEMFPHNDNQIVKNYIKNNILNENEKLEEVISADEYVERMKKELSEINTATVVTWCKKQLQNSYNERKLTQLEIARDMILDEYANRITEDKQTNNIVAEKYGLTPYLNKLTQDLMNLKYVTKVDYDLMGYIDNIEGPITLVSFDIDTTDEEFSAINRINAKNELKKQVLDVMKNNGVNVELDEFEDNDTYFYIVSYSTNWNTEKKTERRVLGEYKEIQTEDDDNDTKTELYNKLINEMANNLGISKYEFKIEADNIKFRYNNKIYFAEPRSMYQVNIFDGNHNQIGWGVLVNEIKEEVFTEYTNDDYLYQLVGGKYAGTYTREEAGDLPILKPELTGENTGRRKELQKQLQFKGYLGPMWNGTKDGKAIIRYETPEVYDMLSENKLVEETDKEMYKRIKEEPRTEKYEQGLKLRNEIVSAWENKDLETADKKWEELFNLFSTGYDDDGNQTSDWNDEQSIRDMIELHLITDSIEDKCVYDVTDYGREKAYKKMGYEN